MGITVTKKRSPRSKRAMASNNQTHCVWQDMELKRVFKNIINSKKLWKI